MFLVYHGAMQRLLISFGLLLTAIGLLWPWLSKLPFGHLPGDLRADRPDSRFSRASPP
ncbi:MAG: DUF2905 domain-containing protein [Steroidobacteraceae bacterium]|nr:DUF2905 domain-containing protein [Steroidobacteraceae bacterium]